MAKCMNELRTQVRNDPRETWCARTHTYNYALEVILPDKQLGGRAKETRETVKAFKCELRSRGR